MVPRSCDIPEGRGQGHGDVQPHTRGSMAPVGLEITFGHQDLAQS